MHKKLFFGLILVAYSVFADKITLEGAPINLINQGDNYSFGTDQIPPNEYHYVNLNGATKVCTIINNSKFGSATVINIQEKEDVIPLYCYDINSNYFEIK